MVRCLVTGAAGFIGSHLTERLLQEGHSVVGLDSFSDYYPRIIKEKNVSNITPRGNFRFVETDILQVDLSSLLEGIDYVFHQAAQPGVRASWGADFGVYVRDNISATQKLLEACKNISLKKFIFASSSSVYGNASKLPITEETPTRPVSPYGVTKLAAESLCLLYWVNYGVPVVSLRYFTVFGPRQRPDMAFSRFIASGLKGASIDIFGDGEQTRDCTYIGDIVEANISAMRPDIRGEVFNIGSSRAVSVNQVITILKEIMDKELKMEYSGRQKGDANHTLADISRAAGALGYNPAISINEGLKRQYQWLLQNYPDGIYG